MTRTLRIRFLLVGFILVSSSQMSEAQTNRHDWALWNGLFWNQNHHEQWKFVVESQLRLNAETPSNNRIVLRPGVEWQFHPEWSTMAGLGWTPQMTGFNQEIRLWEQIQYRTKNSLFRGRLRIEQRSIEGARWGHRLRILARTDFQDWVLWDEVFLHLRNHSRTQNNVFDQNRIFLGRGFPVLDQKRMEFGYLLVFQKTASSHLLTHTAAIFFFI